jgi:transmembrane sensor
MNTRQERPSEAARWFARMHDDQRTSAEEAELHRWLAQDPENERAYQRLETLWAGVEQVRNEPAVKAARAQALEESRHAMWQRVEVPRWKLLGTAAAIVALAVGLFFARPYVPIDRVYQTGVGDRRTFQLVDGSELTLNTDSIARVHYEFGQRIVDLERGQAHFKVAHSALRPFLVNAGRGVIRAIGTEFDVYRWRDEVKVTLVEGRIEVISAMPSLQGTATTETPASDEVSAAQSTRTEMVAGQALSLSARGVSALAPANLSRATAWLEGKLIFDNERLEDAVAEMNRYSASRIVVLDRELAELRVNGVFRTDGAAAFVEAVGSTLPVKVERASDGTLVIARQN